jgi:hypothetical protein
VSRPRVLRPPLGARFANVGLGLVVVAAGVFLLATDDRMVWMGVSVVVIIVGVGLCVRMWRYSVTLGPEGMLVRGVLWSRYILRESIKRVGDTGWVSWVGPGGRVRRTPLTMFWTSGRSLPVFERSAAEGIREVRSWAKGHS